MGESLTKSELADLQRCERIIERGQKTFLQVGLALSEIRDRKLYRERCETFPDYCEQVWGFSKSRAYQLIEAAKVEQSLGSSTIVDEQAPTLPRESHARELARLPDNQRAECLAEARDMFGDGMTAAQLKTRVDLWLADNEPPDPAELSPGDDDEEDDCQDDPEPEPIEHEGDDEDEPEEEKEEEPEQPTKPTRPIFSKSLALSFRMVWRNYPEIDADMAAATLHALAADIQDGAFTR